MKELDANTQSVPANGPTVISAKEAAALIGIHHTTLYEAARRGDIPCRRVGRRFVFVREPLIHWLMTGAAE
jgi:excisionase family DNA binding protein